MKKKDYKLIGLYYIAFISVVALGYYYMTKPEEYKFDSQSLDIESNTSQIVADTQGELSTGIGNDGVYKTDKYTANISNVTDPEAWIYVDLTNPMNFNQDMLDFSFLPNSDEFPNIKSQPQFNATVEAPTLISNYVWGYGWHNNYLRDYKLWNYTVDINKEFKIGLIGWANDTEVNNFSILLFVNPFGVGTFNPDPQKGDIDFESVDYDQVLLTEDDTERLTYFIEENNRYPNEGEVELKGLVTYEQYKELFDNRPLEDRDVHYVVGKALNHDNSL